MFTHELPRELASSANITILTNANVKEVECGEDGCSVESLRVASSPEHDFRVRGRLVVIAAGAIENARLMLNSTRSQPGGLGNQNDLVGRYFMNRQVVQSGFLVPTDNRFYDRISAYDVRLRNGRLLAGKLIYSEETLRQWQMLNLNTQLWPQHSARAQAALDSLRALAGFRRAGYLSAVPGYVARALWGAPALLDTGLRLALVQRQVPPRMQHGGWSRLPGDSASLRRLRRCAPDRTRAIARQPHRPGQRARLLRDAEGARGDGVEQP